MRRVDVRADVFLPLLAIVVLAARAVPTLGGLAGSNPNHWLWSKTSVLGSLPVLGRFYFDSRDDQPFSEKSYYGSAVVQLLLLPVMLLVLVRVMLQ